MVTDIEKEIKRHTESVIRGTTPAPSGFCPRCGGEPEKFSVHDRRERTFRFIVESFVKIVVSILVRWKCPLCKRTFTHYPVFAAPYKRYVLPGILRLSSSYVNDEVQSYRGGVRHRQMPIGYEGSRESEIDERMLEASTLWRWVGYLGNMVETIKEALRLIREMAPSCSIFRENFAVPSRKYRKSERKSLLQRVKKLFSVSLKFAEIFGHPIFPRFATACSWK